MELPENILLIDKPTGITSFDVIRRLRQKTGIRKYGHAGTLDPAASGLMIIGANEGTKKLNEYLKLPKEYVAEILLGERRSTGDMDGEVIEAADVRPIKTEVLSEVLAGMVGTLRLPVSAYSAIKKGGVPMYKRAREAASKGEVITDVPIRDMEVHEAELLGAEHRDAKMVVTARFCRKRYVYPVACGRVWKEARIPSYAQKSASDESGGVSDRKCRERIKRKKRELKTYPALPCTPRSRTYSIENHKRLLPRVVPVFIPGGTVA